MTSFAYITHQVGAFHAEIQGRQKQLVDIINKNGLKSKNQLIADGIFKPEPVKGIFSDEHDNIYFWASQKDAENEHNQVQYSIRVDADKTYTYNVAYRGAVDYFSYQASQMTMNTFLERQSQCNELRVKLENGGLLNSKVILGQHPLTATPVLINLEYSYKNLPLHLSYGAEVACHSNNISPNYFTIYPTIANDKLSFVTNKTSLVLEVKDDNQRGLFLDNDGQDKYTPNKNFVGDDFDRIYLKTAHDYYKNPLNLRYDCNYDAERIELQPNHHKDIIFPKSNHYARVEYCNSNCPDESDYVKIGDYVEIGSDFGRIRVIIADERDNIIQPENIHKNTVMGGKGADKFVFHETYFNQVVLDFSHIEGDKIALPSHLYSNVEQVLDSLYVNNNITIIPLGSLGSLLLPNLEQNLVGEDLEIF